MSVRLSLLAILDQGPCYGYQLRSEFDRRTGSTWSLNVGQIYNTLDRLERDGLVQKAGSDEQGHVYYAITGAGEGAVRDWLDTPVGYADGTRQELPIKLALAATLPGADAEAIIRTQRSACLTRLDDFLSVPEHDDGPVGAEEIAGALLRDAMICALEAELSWLDRAEQRLLRHPGHSLALGLATDRPRRGRPLKARASGDREGRTVAARV